jgi:predicted restriction endonuclease
MKPMTVVLSATSEHETHYRHAVLAIRQSRVKTHKRPHKLVLLLAVLNLIDAQEITENKIYLNSALEAEFERLFKVNATNDDMAQIAPPFFHLKSSGFWHHKVKPERIDEYAKLTTGGGWTATIHKFIEYAFLDEDFFQLLLDFKIRHNFSELLIAKLENS